MFLISIEDCIRVYVDTMSLEFFNVFLKCEDLEKSRVRKKTPYRIFIFEKQNLNEKDLKMRSRMSELIFQGMSPNASRNCPNFHIPGCCGCPISEPTDLTMYVEHNRRPM